MQILAPYKLFSLITTNDYYYGLEPASGFDLTLPASHDRANYRRILLANRAFGFGLKNSPS